ncbi:MAG TPA: ATP-binding protein, partial [Candidatus Caenarcaniphilales bacterium]
AFWQMLATFPTVAHAILRTMAERVQTLQSMSQQRESLIALGTLAADLAHELNHPATAICQDAQQLDAIFQELAFSGLQMNQPLAGVPALPSSAGLLDEIEQGATYISELVTAMKGYSYMDQAPLQEVDVHQGLESTLTILRHKLKDSVIVQREYDQSLPRISAYGSELNQVWTNLIDNAIDAVGDQGQIWLRTWREDKQVLVEIADNGQGIPPEIVPRIFEPFFTTKGVGQGTGLGLVTSYRTIIGKHHGDIHVFSQPGDTRFQVRLPINQVQ